MREAFQIDPTKLTAAAIHAMTADRRGTLISGNVSYGYALHAASSTIYFYRRKPNRETLAYVNGNYLTVTPMCEPGEKAAIEAIINSPLEAAKLHGRERKSCAVCRAGLIEAMDKAVGIHPQCASKMDWTTEAVPDTAIDSPIK